MADSKRQTPSTGLQHYHIWLCYSSPKTVSWHCWRHWCSNDSKFVSTQTPHHYIRPKFLLKLGRIPGSRQSMESFILTCSKIIFFCLMQNEIVVDNDWWAEGTSAGKGWSGRRPDLIQWAPASGCWTSPAAAPEWCCPGCLSASSLPAAAAAPWTRGRVGYLDHPLQFAACLPTIKQTGTCKTTACTL